MQQFLNFDVVELVCELLDDAATVLSLSLASRTLRPVALKRLLRMRPVALVDGRSVRAFHEFAVADAESRFPFIRALDIRILELEEQARQDVVQLILDLLARATHLESLTLPCPKDTFRCLADPRIPEAISRLATLHELGLLGECDEVEAIIKSTRSVSSLRVLRVSLGSPPVFGAVDIPTVHFDALMRHLAPTLEVLDITERTALFIEKGAQYPALRSLRMELAQAIVPTDILVYKFPALDGTLSLGPMLELHMDVPNQRRVREANMAQQQQRSWARLDRVVGDPLVLFVLGLTCPVRHLMLDVHYISHTVECRAEVLRTTPPTHLKMTIMLCYGPRVRPELFLPEVVPRLTHLALVLLYNKPAIEVTEREDITTMQWKDLLSSIVEAIRPLHLTHLRLFVYIEIEVTGFNSMYPYSTDFVRAIASLHYQQVAKELMDAVPSLQYVFLSAGSQYEVWRGELHDPVKRGRWLVHSAWKNELLPSKTPKELDEDVMERMLLEEDLFLSAQDNVLLGLNRTYSQDETAPWPIGAIYLHSYESVW